jgi:carbamoyl-phosphate synthase small subunit
MQSNQAWLLLEDGTLMQGFAAGKIGTATGEICFNTGMTGYQEIFTDPSYFGQLMVMTNVHIGNYGTAINDEESASIKISGLICRDFNIDYSRKLADCNIQEYFEKNNLVGISGIDTRSLVRHIRTKGAMNGIISSEFSDPSILKEMLDRVPSMDGLELASKVFTQTPYEWGDPDAPLRVAILDFGVKKNILKNLADRGCFLKVFPGNTPFEIVASFNPDGYFLSNGPGDPAAMSYAVDIAKKILAIDKPLFGICLGHQLLALAMDLPTYKMHHGHRGINHPVKNLVTGKSEITSQNHGFGVSPEALQEKAALIEITHINLNDQTIEGIQIKGKKAFSVQYHPEASPGPHDSRYLFDNFIQLMKN